MKIVNSSNIKRIPIDTEYFKVIDTVDIQQLKKDVKALSIPRDFYNEPEQNIRAGEWIYEKFQSFGYSPFFQGEYNNVIASVIVETDLPYIVVGAHYDSVPNTPGADDNASAVIAMLHAAKAVIQHDFICNILFVAFNLEEHGMLGSKSFVKDYVEKNKLTIKNTHILEMVGYTSNHKQQIPKGIPIKLPESSDFLGIVSNKTSNKKLNLILSIAKSYLPNFNTVGLKVFFGLEKIFKDLGRSDHSSFWQKNIPAMMWTDTSEFRNPNYHQASDLPATLDYDFMRNTIMLLILVLIIESDK